MIYYLKSNEKHESCHFVLYFCIIFHINTSIRLTRLTGSTGTYERYFCLNSTRSLNIAVTCHKKQASKHILKRNIFREYSDEHGINERFLRFLEMTGV